MEDSSDEIEPCQNIGPHEIEESVRSNAVMKYSTVQVPAHFNRLECNTNLNLPPSNWLTTSNSSQGLHQALYQSAGFASFRLGQRFPDCVGEVDVVSDAENIKKLLKLPYTSKAAISMIVHKVGNTLLLDEFDIQKYLLRKSNDDWDWLRTFMLKQIFEYGDKENNYGLRDKSREALQTKNLLSKFLYYSLLQSSMDDDTESNDPSKKEWALHRPTVPCPVLPEPKINENIPDSKSSFSFNRNVVWTFENIQMLLGTNMQIFGGSNRPCISLRLRDMAKPINVLTGIDYWLDNLMCNVPEVVMCYHLDGLVQKYEIIKTEDLPYLENSQFSPQIVRNVAQHILSFLKANATKAGHTYWLFKGKNDDVVKLYDLTTLCKTENEDVDAHADVDAEKKENPFTVPVGMLFYSVARNMKNTTQQLTPKTAGNIRALLDDCIKLLPKEKYPQIVTSSHYILSDLNVPAGIDPKSPKFDEIDSDEQSLYDDDEHDESELDDAFNYRTDDRENAAMQHIYLRDTLKDFKTGKKSHKPSPFIAGTEERCQSSLQHISAGLSCLQYFNANQEDEYLKDTEAHAKEEEKQRILEEEQNPNMAKPFNAIPLPYESLQKCKLTDSTAEANSKQNSKQRKAKQKRCKIKELEVASNVVPSNQQLSENFNNQQFGSWNIHLKLLLLEKACLTYATLAEHSYDAKQYTDSLKYVKLSSRCHLVLSKYMSNTAAHMSCLFRRAGDCYLNILKNWDDIETSIKQSQEFDSATNIIRAQIEKELTPAEDIFYSILIEPVKCMKKMLSASSKCYEKALELVPKDDKSLHKELLKSFGNVTNELGVLYMHLAQGEHNEIVSTVLMNEKKDVITIDDDDDDPMDSDNFEDLDDNDANVKAIERNEPRYYKWTIISFTCLKRSIAAFTELKDSVNIALLNCNMARLMRLRAHFIFKNENNLCLATEKYYYNQAFKYYEKAKESLGSRKQYTDFWDLVHWELSTSTFLLAKQLQDFSDVRMNYETASKEVLEMLQRSLKFCDVEHNNSRQILYVFRSAMVHKRIASLHHSQLLPSNNKNLAASKTIIQLCKSHYDKAAQILQNLNDSSELLVVQLERISLYEILAEISTHSTQKFKHLYTVLEICFSCEKAFEHILEMVKTNEALTFDEEVTEETDDKKNYKKLEKFLKLFESRLQNALKTLTKLLLTGKDPKNLLPLYRNMYTETLNGKRQSGAQQAEECVYNTERLINLIKRLKSMNTSTPKATPTLKPTSTNKRAKDIDAKRK